MSKTIAKIALSAAELNQRASLIDLTKDGVHFVGAQGFSPIQREDGSIDRSATGDAQLRLARDFATVAFTPDKALILGVVAGTGGEEGKVSAGGAVVGTVVGGIADVVEAVPAVLLSIGYLATGAVNKLRG